MRPSFQLARENSTESHKRRGGGEGAVLESHKRRRGGERAVLGITQEEERNWERDSTKKTPLLPSSC